MVKDIIGYEDLYSITDSGKVWSKKTKKWRKLGVTKNGYYHVDLYPGGKSFLVHRLVAEHFVPNHKKSPQVNHIDGNKLNNNVTNLEWCTARENAIHAFTNGLRVARKGERHSNAKLTKSKVKKIINLYNNGLTQEEIAQKYSVYQSVISRIVNKKSWC